MNTDSHILEGLKWLLLVTGGVNLLLYWGVVCVTLYCNGAKFPTGLLPWRYFHDLHGYRQLLVARGKSTNWYFSLLLFTWFTIGLALVVGILALQQAQDQIPVR